MRLIISILLFFSVIACTEKVQTSNPTTLETTFQGTETHGGDILRARALSYRDSLLLNESQLKAKQLRDGESEVPVRDQALKIWKAISMSYKRMPDSKLRINLEFLVHGDSNGDIFADIQTSPYTVKVFRSPVDPNLNNPEYGVCTDYHGSESTAGAGLNDRSGTICFDAKKLAVEAASYSDLVALASHEHAHHLGLSEDEAVEIQKFIISNWKALAELGAYYTAAESNGIVIDDTEAQNGINIIVMATQGPNTLNLTLTDYDQIDLFSHRGLISNKINISNQPALRIQLSTPPFSVWSGTALELRFKLTQSATTTFDISIQIQDLTGKVLAQSVILKANPLDYLYDPITGNGPTKIHKIIIK